MQKKTKFIELKQVFKKLHSRRGCMWDKKQTHKSILKDLKEEVDEFVAAVERDDPEHMKEEVGDLLLHVMFHAQIASKNGKFDIEDVISYLVAKLKRRHPHVFAGKKVMSTREIITNWNRIKKQEKRK